MDYVHEGSGVDPSPGLLTPGSNPYNWKGIQVLNISTHCYYHPSSRYIDWTWFSSEPLLVLVSQKEVESGTCVSLIVKTWDRRWEERGTSVNRVGTEPRLVPHRVRFLVSYKHKDRSNLDDSGRDVEEFYHDPKGRIRISTTCPDNHGDLGTLVVGT